MIRSLLESVFQWRGVRMLAGIALLTRGFTYWHIGARYRAICDYCWVVRVSGIDFLKPVAWSRIGLLVQDVRGSGHNRLVDWYLASTLSVRCARSYTISGGGPHELFRDIIVLKSPVGPEKGVILLKYARTFEAVVALLDLNRLLGRYVLVLEPCWAGYCDPALLMYVQAHPVLVQCFTDDDFDLVRGIGPPFHAVRLGPADWVNAGVFGAAEAGPKSYDLIMVANWGAHKRHRELFRALRNIDDREVRVALVGFPWAGRTTAHIRREAAGIGRANIHVEIFESVPHDALARLLAKAKAFVFLSRKEGDNKALVEALFAGVPAIVYDKTIGGARGRINAATGILSSDGQLAANIRHMLDHYRDFAPRTWALEHTGSVISTRILNNTLKAAITAAGGEYLHDIVEKCNAPNLAYRDPGCQEQFSADDDFIRSCLRPRWTAGAS